MATIANLFCEALLAFARLLSPQRAGARYIVLLGPPAAGKGTQAQLLEPRIGLKQLSMGALIREFVKTRRGAKWAPIVKKGGLLPGWLVLWLLFKELRKPLYNNGVILDGVPRTRAQAFWLRIMLGFWGHRFGDAVFLDVPESDTVERLEFRRTCPVPECGRSYHLKLNPPAKPGFCDVCGSELVQRDDDKPEAIKERFRLFYETAGPLLDFFAKLGVLLRIKSTNAMSVQQVFEDVYFALEETD